MPGSAPLNHLFVPTLSGHYLTCRNLGRTQQSRRCLRSPGSPNFVRFLRTLLRSEKVNGSQTTLPGVDKIIAQETRHFTDLFQKLLFHAACHLGGTVFFVFAN